MQVLDAIDAHIYRCLLLQGLLYWIKDYVGVCRPGCAWHMPRLSAYCCSNRALSGYFVQFFRILLVSVTPSARDTRKTNITAEGPQHNLDTFAVMDNSRPPHTSYHPHCADPPLATWARNPRNDFPPNYSGRFCRQFYRRERSEQRQPTHQNSTGIRSSPLPANEDNLWYPPRRSAVCACRRSPRVFDDELSFFVL